MASLNPLSMPLDLRRAKHLLRRATFHYTKSELTALTNMTAMEAVNNLMIDTPNTLSEPYDPLPTGTPDGFWTSSLENPNSFDGQTRKRALVTAWWWHNAVQQPTLKHKLSFFLHTSFTVGKDSGTGAATYFYDHMRLLDFYAFGNIKTLAKKITLDNAMLYYLNNTQNNKNNPNENYAREYLELFTILKGEQIGEGDYTNYTEIDIQQTAKVFSGFKARTDRSDIDPQTNIPTGYANFNQHDPNNKTFSSAFGNTIIEGARNATDMQRELHDFVEMVFAQQETAKAYCRKLYRYFVRRSWDNNVETEIITPLSQILIANDYEILPVVKALLASEHFYDADDTDASDNIIGGQLKSPLQLASEIISFFNIPYPDPTHNASRYYKNFFQNFLHDTYFKAAGMEFYNPDSVAGYPAYYQQPDYDRNWFSSNTLIGRYKLIESFIAGKNTITSGSIYCQLDTVLFAENNLYNPSNPVDLITELADLLFPESIDADRTNYFKTFLFDESFPDYYWTNVWEQYLLDDNKTTVKVRLDALITAMVNAAEFQLM